MEQKNGYKITIEHRITKIEESMRNMDDAIAEIRDNHLVHLLRKIEVLSKRMWWGVGFLITTFVGIIVELIFKTI